VDGKKEPLGYSEGVKEGKKLLGEPLGAIEGSELFDGGSDGDVDGKKEPLGYSEGVKEGKKLLLGVLDGCEDGKNEPLGAIEG